MTFVLGMLFGIISMVGFLVVNGRIGSSFWSSFGSLGQWVGAIITSIALYYAVRKDEPRIRLEALRIPKQSYISVSFLALSASYIPVTINRFCIISSKFKKSTFNVYDMNIPLKPMEKAEIISLDLDLLMSNGGFKDLHDLTKHCYVIDTFGKKHFFNNSYCSKLKRYLLIQVFVYLSTEK